MGNITKAVIKGERVFTKFQTYFFYIAIAGIAMLIISNVFKKNKTDEDKKVKKYTIPILLVLVLFVAAAYYNNKLTQDSNNYAKISGAVNIASLLVS